MEQVEHTDAQSPTQTTLHRAEIRACQVEEEDVGSTTWKNWRKKEARPESIYEAERVSDEEPGGEEAAEKSLKEGATFLRTPLGEARGKKKGQVVDIHVTLTAKKLRELARSKERLDAEYERSTGEKWPCILGPLRGPHVLLWSLYCTPVVFLLSFISSFYYGTLTWYSVFLVYNKERTFWHKITVCPFLIISYPVLIMAVSLSLALYATVVQVSWAFSKWWLAARDLEKGFCGWACERMGLEDCSPYSVVELLGKATEDLQTTSV